MPTLLAYLLTALLALPPGGAIAGRLQVEEGKLDPHRVEIRVFPSEEKEPLLRLGTATDYELTPGMVDTLLDRAAARVVRDYERSPQGEDRPQAGEAAAAAEGEEGPVAEADGDDGDGVEEADDPGAEAEEANGETMEEGGTETSEAVDASEPLPVTADVSTDGTFRLSGLPPGVYGIEVRLPGYAPAWLEPVRVPPSGRVELPRPLVLARTLDLTVEVEPKAAPGGAPWEVALLDVEPSWEAMSPHLPREVVHEFERGRFVLAAQRPGRFALRVRSPDGNTWHTATVSIHDPSEAALSVHLRSIAVAGRVIRGEEPLAGQVWLRHDESGARFESEAGEDGRFRVDLPFPGSWRAQVLAGEVLYPEAAVEVVPEADGPAALEIRLPATRIFGQVVNPDGKPVPGGTLRVWSAGPSQDFAVDSQGRFEALGASPGTVSLEVLTAESGEGTPVMRVGEPADFELEPDRPLGPLTLTLRHGKRVAGRLTVRGEPVGDIWIQALIDGHLVGMASAHLDGRFELSLPVDAKRATLVLFPPADLPMQMVDVALDGRALEVELEARSGTLEVLVPEGWNDVGPQPSVLELTVRGSYAPYPRWPKSNAPDRGGGEPKTVAYPRLAPGPYEVCLGPAGHFQRIDPAARKTARTVCARGRLRAGQTLRLDLTGR